MSDIKKISTNKFTKRKACVLVFQITRHIIQPLILVKNVSYKGFPLKSSDSVVPPSGRMKKKHSYSAPSPINSHNWGGGVSLGRCHWKQVSPPQRSIQQSECFVPVSSSTSILNREGWHLHRFKVQSWSFFSMQDAAADSIKLLKPFVASMHNIMEISTVECVISSQEVLVLTLKTEVLH